MQIESDDPAAPAIYTALAKQVLAAGGRLHPGLRLHQQGGSLWASVDARAVEAEPDTPLIHVPETLLVPTSDLDWSTPGSLTPSTGLATLDVPQRRMLDLMLELYALTGKLDSIRQCLPELALPPESPLWALLQDSHRAARTPETAQQAFIRTRTLGYRRRAKQPEAGMAGGGEAAKTAKTTVLMPLIDVINHHPDGAAFSTRQGGVRLKPRRSSGTAECHARYGYRDAMVLLLVYGYVAREPRFVQSIRCTVSVPGLGPLTIQGQDHRVPLDLPGLARSEDGTLLISHLNFDADHPRRAMQTLRVIAAGQYPDLPAAELDRMARQADAAIRATNAAHYQQLLGYGEAGRSGYVGVRLRY